MINYRLLFATTIIIFVSMVFVSGCGLDNNPTSPDTQPGGYFRVTNVNVHGRSVPCVTWKLGYAGGLSCDWSSK